jgi:magnesium chelatase family protein
MLARTASVALIGTEGRLVDVEVDVSTGVPRFTTVGLPTKSVREAEQRVHSALLATGLSWPKQRIVANLAPGELRKEGTHFDLPIALGLLVADGRLEADRLRGWVVLGELALDGSVRPVRGVLAAAMACREAGSKGFICPGGNAPEAALVDGIEVIAVASLRECIDWMEGKGRPPPVIAEVPAPPPSFEDLSEVKGHATARRALEIAAAGGHNLFIIELRDRLHIPSSWILIPESFAQSSIHLQGTGASEGDHRTVFARCENEICKSSSKPEAR